MPNLISEDDIEKALLKRLQEHGFDLLNCHTADRTEIKDGSNRTDKRDVILGDRLKLAAQHLNPDIPETAIDQAVKNVMDRRTALSAIEANRELDRLIRDGVPIQYDLPNGKQENAFVRLIDFNQTANNHFLAVSQLWIQAQGFDARAAYRRPDVILYVNGLPLVFIELKNSTVKLRNAFDDNLTDYKRDIPQLFHCNAFCILSNAIATKVGSFTAGWEHFFSWLRVEDEKEKVNRPQIEQQGTSLEIAIAGICTPDKLLDYVENFILYHQGRQKIIAQNHQFIGVNNAFDLFAQRESRSPEERKKLGVFWHTQGSGKSFSMIFYARKVFRKLKGNYTFAIVTDRTDLDGQIYKNFLNTDTVAQNEAAQPKNSEEMRKFFGQNKRVVFTLIQKFRYDKGKTYPLLSDRNDIIVMVDEAHRTQYAALAENMRTGLPNANFMAFTGTPLLGKDRKTNEWFGDYVSEYNFQQAMDDGATVPLFYEKRVSEMMNQNENLSEEFYQLLEDEDLDEAQQAKLEKKFATEMQVIKRDDRLEAIAKDIVYHFANRGYLGKGLMVAIDKFTAVKMYDKVQQQWKVEIKNLVGKISKSDNDIEKAQLRRIVEYMRSVEMAVVISEDANEVKKFAAQRLDIKPHRDRLHKVDAQGHDLEYNFKDPKHPLQLVFVCAMWLTGFDAPTLSTLYLDKPMRGHTLMQTIARANRVASHQIAGHHGKAIEKKNGEIVDYYNVFRNMKAALKEYAQGSDGGEDAPVQEKSHLFELLDRAIAETEAFCLERAIDLQQVLHTENTFAPCLPKHAIAFST
jgi:type I restriction enzyme, R subunit